MQIEITQVGIVGAGAMGQGIAQLAAEAGCTVRLLDTRPGAAHDAVQAIVWQWERLAESGKRSTQAVHACRTRLFAAADLAELAACDLVVEAIAEQADAKRALLAELEGTVAPGALLASNTSSLSITALKTALGQPQRRDRQIGRAHV